MRHNSRSSNIVQVADNTFDRIQARNGLAIKNGSQFANISGMSNIEIEAREQEAATTKLQRRVESLTKLQATLGTVNASLAALYLAERPEQRKLLRSALAELDSWERVPTGAAAPLRKAKNELISMREAVQRVSAATKSKREFTVIACQEAHETVTQLLTSAKEKLNALTKPVVHAASEVNAAEMEDILKKTKESKLPAIGKSGYALGRAPVIPTANVNADKLAQNGFKVDHSSGYTVIHNQLLLGVSKKFLEENNLKQLEGAKKLCQFLAKHQKVKLVLVSDHPAATVGLKGVAWYWAMPEREYNAFTKAVHGKTGQLETGKRMSSMRWGLAF